MLRLSTALFDLSAAKFTDGHPDEPSPLLDLKENFHSSHSRMTWWSPVVSKISLDDNGTHFRIIAVMSWSLRGYASCIRENDYTQSQIKTSGFNSILFFWCLSYLDQDWASARRHREFVEPGETSIEVLPGATIYTRSRSNRQGGFFSVGPCSTALVLHGERPHGRGRKQG